MESGVLVFPTERCVSFLRVLNSFILVVDLSFVIRLLSLTFKCLLSQSGGATGLTTEGRWSGGTPTFVSVLMSDRSGISSDLVLDWVKETEGQGELVILDRRQGLASESTRGSKLTTGSGKRYNPTRVEHLRPNLRVTGPL